MSSALNAYTQFTKFKPNPMQEELFTHIALEGENPALLLKAPHRGVEKQRLYSYRVLIPNAGFF